MSGIDVEQNTHAFLIGSQSLKSLRNGCNIRRSWSAKRYSMQIIGNYLGKAIWHFRRIRQKITKIHYRQREIDSIYEPCCQPSQTGRFYDSKISFPNTERIGTHHLPPIIWGQAAESEASSPKLDYMHPFVYNDTFSDARPNLTCTVSLAVNLKRGSPKIRHLIV